MRVGELRHRIEIRAFVSEVNLDDIPVKAWKTIHTARAKVLNVRGSEYLQAQGVGSNISKTFYIRDPRNIEITKDNQIIYDGETYNIVYVNNILDQDLYLEIKVELKQ